MAMLHIVNKSPFERDSLDSCLRLAEEGSSVLFTEDGIYGALKNTKVADKVSAANGIKFFVLGPDVKARGMNEDKLIDGIDVVDYAGFVDLTAEHDVVQSWL
jgi:tRNA 2-thiouridine synthesizing protein B